MGGSESKLYITLVTSKSLRDSLLTGLWLKNNNNFLNQMILWKNPTLFEIRTMQMI